MFSITDKQVNILNRLTLSNLLFNDLDEESTRIARFLVSQGCVGMVTDPNSDTGKKIGFSITEKGKDVLYQFKSEKRYKRRTEVRAWITTVIAVLAFILSVLSLSWQIYSWRLKEAKEQEVSTMAAHVFSYIQ